MKNILFLIMFFPVALYSQDFKKDNLIYNSKTADAFINSFYQSQNNLEMMISYFDQKYFNTFYKFNEHMVLKNEKYGNFVEKKLLKIKDSKDINFIRRQYLVKYQKGSLIEIIELKRNPTNNEYKITHWQTK